jgi:DNA (cytosine-5)-methyltransferase 1
MNIELTFYEFFAGGGLARLGLGERWTCLFANDISEKKAEAYRNNFACAGELLVGDIHKVNVHDLPSRATLAWASFPCQDLSLAGNGHGIHAARSGTFWPFWQLMLDLQEEGRKVPLIAIENVVGLLTANNGEDFVTLCRVISEAGYNLGALIINAEWFVPQSRPRLFMIAVDNALAIPEELFQFAPYGPWFPSTLINAYYRLPSEIKKHWLWWSLPAPSQPSLELRDIIENDPTDVSWHTTQETAKLLGMMSETNLAKVYAAQKIGTLQVGAIYKRTRQENGKRVQRAEIRFDKSGCLRTPAGGSSRQILLFVEGDEVKSRLLSPREAARLMGLDDSYKLPERYNDAYHVMGDAVAIPVITWLEKHILHQVIIAQQQLLKADKVWLKPQLSLVDY